MNEDFCPKLLDDTLILEESSKTLFLVPSKPDWLVVNQNVATLLRLCDGNTSLKNIRKELASHKNSDEALSILEKLLNDGFFTPFLEESRRNNNILHSLHLNMTENCNLQCVYCYAEERTKIESVPLSKNDYYQIIDEVYKINKNIVITFTGGEPLLNSMTFDVAKHCKSKGISTFLLTNGLLIDSQNIKLICELFDTIRISVDAYTESIHDSLRGRRSYQKVMNAIEMLENENFPPNIAMTVNKENINEIQVMAERFGSRLTFQPLYQLGNARNKNLEISGTEYFEALKNTLNVEPYGQIAQKMASLKNKACSRCAMGDGEISISHAGDVYPCHLLHTEQFKAGNITEKSFTEIYANSIVLKDIRKLTVDTREECQECPVRFLCCGGCWARAFYTHGDLNTADDFCEYEMLAFKEALLQS